MIRNPGSNLLRMALTVIQPQTPQLIRFTGRETLDNGVDVSTYAQPEDIIASMQSVTANQYVALGLSFQRKYMAMYTTADVAVPDRDSGGDRVQYGTKLLQTVQPLDWRAQDGWMYVLLVEIPPDPQRQPVTGTGGYS